MTPLDEDAEIIAAAREGFLDEAADMLAQFEQALLVMETDPGDAENMNAAFRAAHTIKGTAGLFGCDAVVSFTHEVETLLDALRAGELSTSDDIAAALLQSLDQMASLLDEVRSGQRDPAVAQTSQSLGAQLRALRRGPADAVAEQPTPADATDSAQATAAPPPGCWHLSMRFGPDALRSGLDPLAFFRYLATLGQVRGVHCFDDAIPALGQLDPEHCHLGFEMQFDSTGSRDEIERVFEFAMDDLSLVILPPDASASDYQALLNQRTLGLDEEAALQVAAELQSVWIQLGAWPRPDPAEEAAPAQPEPSRAVVEQKAETPLASAPATPTATDRKTSPGRDRRPGADETRFVKVRADKLDKLIDLIGELVIASSGAQMLAHGDSPAALLEASQRVSDLVQSARDGALALRMVPVGETFARFQRIVRDVSKQLGKDIELNITGGDTELDKSMVDVIADPLVHLVRNSLDHGIETPAERLAAGKPATGQLKLNAYHEAGSIVIEVSDDGRGLRRDRILAKALERGLIEEGSHLSDPEVWQLIFMPGFSTADAVTDLSGRGVGMDVVKRNIESLRGQIALSSREGHGTTTQVRLPLTLAMIDGFLTMVGGAHYVLPLAVVAECIDLPTECRQHPERVAGTFDLRGEVLPYLDLAHFYGLSSEASHAGKPSDHAGPSRRSLVMVREGSIRVGLVVDRLLGEHQTVIKPLPAIFRDLRALAGSTILGSGEVALVLDLPGLMTAAKQALRALSMAEGGARWRAQPVPERASA